MENPSKHIGIFQRHDGESPGLIADALERTVLGQRCASTFAGNSVPHVIGSAAIKLNAHTYLPPLQKIGRPVFARWIALLT
jgi:hypothetical protein